MKWHVGRQGERKWIDDCIDDNRFTPALSNIFHIMSATFCAMRPLQFRKGFRYEGISDYAQTALGPAFSFVSAHNG
jgi:hypothetical protein